MLPCDLLVVRTLAVDAMDREFRRIYFTNLLVWFWKHFIQCFFYKRFFEGGCLLVSVSH